MSEHFITVKEAAVMLGRNEDTVRQMLFDGIIPGYKIGRLWRLLPSEVESYLEKVRNVPR